MSEQTAIYVLNQIYEHLENTGHMDNERKNALELAMKSLNGSTDFQMMRFVQEMFKQSQEINADEISYTWEMKDGRKIGLTFSIIPTDDELKWGVKIWVTI